MYINPLNWLLQIRTIKVNVLYDMHERSNSTFSEIYVGWQRDFMQVRICEKVKKCYSLDSHTNRNRKYETLQTDSYWYPSPCVTLTAFPSAVWRGGGLGQRIKQLKRHGVASRGLILQTFPAHHWAPCNCSGEKWSHTCLQDRGLTLY